MANASKEIIQKHEQMFYPTVRVRTKKAGGSGTVIVIECVAGSSANSGIYNMKEQYVCVKSSRW